MFVEFPLLQDTIPGAGERDGKAGKIITLIELKF